MKTKIIQVFYGDDYLPYKDKARTVPFPITGNTFLGSSNATKVQFYFDKIGTESDTWVALSKLPNGKIGSEILSIDFDDTNNEYFAILSLSAYYTQYKGDVLISLQGYEGGVTAEFNEEDELYEITGSPAIQSTQPIRLSVNYSPYFMGDGSEQNVTLQGMLALFGTKLNEYSPNIIRVVSTFDGLDLTDFANGQVFYNTTDKKFYQLQDNEIVLYEIFNPNDTFVTVEDEPYVIPPEDR